MLACHYKTKPRDKINVSICINKNCNINQILLLIFSFVFELKKSKPGIKHVLGEQTEKTQLCQELVSNLSND